MDRRHFRDWARARRTPFVLLGILLLFAGVDLLLNKPKGEYLELLSVPLLAAGALVLLYVLWPEEGAAPLAVAGPPPRPTIASALTRRLTLNGRLQPFLPVLGLVLIASDLVFNVVLAATPGYGTQDTIVLMAGFFLVAYRFIPAKFGSERDFLFVFLLVLNLILTLPLVLFRVANADFNASVDVYSSAFLAPQTAWTMRLFGIDASVGTCSQLGLLPAQCALIRASPGLAFTTRSGVQVALFITTSCSGIYSFGLFTSAFAAYVTTEYRRVSARVFVFLVVGVLASYVANILRMTVIGLVGYYAATPQDTLQGMLAAHSNAGWLIFLAWVSLFWVLMFLFLKPEKDPDAVVPTAPAPKKIRVECAVCGQILKVDIPATRCTCGRFYHRACLAGAGACPHCRTPYVERAEAAV